MEVSAERIAQHFNGEIVGNPNVKVSSVAKIESGKPGNICFLANPKYEHNLYTCKASIIIINKEFLPKE
ncbi:MAG: LpxD N-terminal domain-containing protein, partial [Bacteroidales bacterium]